MASRGERTDGWPTVLWITWKVGEVGNEEPLCLVHRAYVFEHYAAECPRPEAQGRALQHVRCTPTPNRPAPQPTRLHNAIG
jgi:hypothetical protein